MSIELIVKILKRHLRSQKEAKRYNKEKVEI